jgi:hypothetical protein
VKNSVIKPFGLVDITIEPRLDINIKRDFIQRFKRETPLEKVVKTFTKENERLVAVFKRRSNGAGVKRGKKRRTEVESSSDDDSDIHPVVQAAINRARERQRVDAEPPVDLDED